MGTPRCVVQSGFLHRVHSVTQLTESHNTGQLKNVTTEKSFVEQGHCSLDLKILQCGKE